MTEIKDIELARPGTWQLASGRTHFTREHLRDAADFFKATGGQKIPIALGHNDPRFSGDPAFGSVRNVRYEVDERGPVLKGDLVDMPGWLHAAAPKRWPNRSIEGYLGHVHEGRLYKLILTGLALLGATPPGIQSIKSLGDLQLAIVASGARRILASSTVARPKTPSTTQASGGADMTDDDELDRDVARLTSAPWGNSDAVDWAVASGRLAASSAPKWRADMKRDPEGTSIWLKTIQPLALDPVLASNDPDAEFLHLLSPAERAKRAQRAAQAIAENRPTYAAAAMPAELGGWMNAVEELRASYPVAVAIAEAAEAPPELFPGSGDYPAATVSGVDPSALAGLPWRAAIVGKWANTRAQCLQIIDDYSGPDGEVEAVMHLDRHPTVIEHWSQVRNWFIRSGVGQDSEAEDEELFRMSQYYPHR